MMNKAAGSRGARQMVSCEEQFRVGMGRDRQGSMTSCEEIGVGRGRRWRKEGK